MTAEPTLVTGDQLDDGRLQTFLDRVYRPQKSAFLHQHGAWWHRGNENRWALVKGDETIAYCAIIPTACLLNGERVPTLWWVDLIVLPEYRGQGLQTRLDQKVRDAADLKLGFPNELAAKIHRKHGWGIRDDLRYLVLPVYPGKLKRVQNAQGVKGLALRVGAGLLSPFAALWRWQAARYQPRTARRIPSPGAAVMAGVFERHMAGQKVVTTYRDADFFRWRFLDSPYIEELAFYFAGPQDAPSHVMITRTVDVPYGRQTRILDLIGDFDDHDGLRDALRLGIRDAIQQGATEVVALASEPRVIGTLRSVGLALSTGGLFCWHSASGDTMSLIGDQAHHWAFADSDNDELTG